VPHAANEWGNGLGIEAGRDRNLVDARRISFRRRDRAMACLSRPDRVAARRSIPFRDDRYNYMAAHWLVRTALSSIDGIPPADWRFSQTPGKPAIDPASGRSELRFNLSRTNGLVACAVCVGSEIGIDVEALAPTHARLAVAERFFSSSEVAVLRHAGPDQLANMFLRFWTLKEAFVKATGTGLSRALDSFSFSLDPISISFHPASADEEKQWQFFERQPTPRHLLALAVRRRATCPVTPTVYQMHAPA
jgi:4'-phosphopantetheinyl transferase